MTWTKLSDNFWSHPKIAALGNEGAGAFCRMLSYCGQHNTDGQIPDAIATSIARPRTLAKIETFGLIERIAEGWFVTDYLDFNPSKAEVEAQRKLTRDRVRRHRKGGK